MSRRIFLAHCFFLFIFACVVAARTRQSFLFIRVQDPVLLVLHAGVTVRTYAFRHVRML